MSVPELVGWDLLYKLVASSLRTESDVIVAITHWFLIKEGEFRCLGNGDKATLDENEESSELLPDNWNENSTSYALRYVRNERVCVLLATVTNETILMNFLIGASLEVSNVAFNLKETVKALRGSLKTLVPTIDALVLRLKKELFEPIKEKIVAPRSAEIQTQTTNEPENLSRVSLFPDRSMNFRDPLAIHEPRRIDPLRNIGRGDLDPLGRIGGGMLFNPPFNPDPLRLPGIIPGARFDPFGPEPGMFPRPGPDPDHLRPPGNPPPGYDDMFM